MPFSISWGLLLLAGLCCLVPGSLAEGSQGNTTQETDISKHDDNQTASHKIGPNLAELTFRLYCRTAHESNTTNTSHVSIASVLTLAALGTRGDTNTQILEGRQFKLTRRLVADIHKRFQHLLHTFNQSGNQLQLTMGNGLFLNQSLKGADKILEAVKKLPNSKVFFVNFRDTEETKKQINTYVEKATQGKIADLVKQLDENTALVLVNYILCKGKEEKPFEPEHTQEGEFSMDEETTVTASIMFHLGISELDQSDELSTWELLMDYVGNATTFFIPPDLGKLQHLEATLIKEHLSKMLKKRLTEGLLNPAAAQSRSVNAHFPKTSLSETFDLKHLLKKLGICKVFNNETDLSGIKEEVPLNLSKLKHQDGPLHGKGGESQ
ncbi:alpha-1-antiproteinase-like isoform X2 [Dasypus novemcinctus]